MLQGEGNYEDMKTWIENRNTQPEAIKKALQSEKVPKITFLSKVSRGLGIVMRMWLFVLFLRLVLFSIVFEVFKTQTELTSSTPIDFPSTCFLISFSHGFDLKI